VDTLNLIGRPAPDFGLSSLDGVVYRLTDAHGKVVVLNFWSSECPWTERADQALSEWMREWDSSVAWWSIASNANETIQQLTQSAARRKVPLVLHDPFQEIADLYSAHTTPHLYVVDATGIVRYQGALDDVTFRQRTPTRFFLKLAVKAVLAGEQPDQPQTPPYGCAIVRFKGELCC